MTTINSILLGITASLIASIIFTWFFTRLKPKIKASEFIAYKDGSYRIKIINKSRFSAINIKAELSYINFFDVPGGREINSHRIPLIKSELFEIESLNRKPEFATYSYRFVTKENIRSGLTEKNRQFVRLKISSIHSLSNIGAVLIKEYSSTRIKDGDFKFGNSFDIIEH